MSFFTQSAERVSSRSSGLSFVRRPAQSEAIAASVATTKSSEDVATPELDVIGTANFEMTSVNLLQLVTQPSHRI